MEKEMKRSQLRDIIREEVVRESDLLKKASELVGSKDVKSFVKAGRALKDDLADDGFDNKDIVDVLINLIWKQVTK
jgi:hypothetical protein